jgi:hypothetical protein
MLVAQARPWKLDDPRRGDPFADAGFMCSLGGASEWVPDYCIIISSILIVD